MHDGFEGDDAEPGEDDTPVTELELPQHIVTRLLQVNIATLSELVEMWDRALLRSSVRGRDREVLRDFLTTRGLLPAEADPVQDEEDADAEEDDVPAEAPEGDWDFDVDPTEEVDVVTAEGDEIDPPDGEDDAQEVDSSIDDQLQSLCESLNESILTIDALRRQIAVERDAFFEQVLQPLQSGLEGLTASAEATRERLVHALENLGEDMEERPRPFKSHLLRESVTYLCLNPEVRAKLKPFRVRTIGDVTRIPRSDLVRRGGFTRENLDYLDAKLEQFVGLSIGADAHHREDSRDTLDDALERSQVLLGEIDDLVEKLIDVSTSRMMDDDDAQLDEDTDSDSEDDASDVHEEEVEPNDAMGSPEGIVTAVADDAPPERPDAFESPSSIDPNLNRPR